MVKRRRAEEEDLERVKALLRERKLDLSLFRDADYEHLASHGFLTAQVFEAATKEDLASVLPGRVGIVALLLESFTVPQGGRGGSVIDWIEMLRLSDEEKKFLDGFLAEEYYLPEQDTGIAKVPVYGGLPSMLLFDLGRKEFTHAAALKEVIELARSKLQNAAVVAGTSGCGKTRSLYDLFSEEDGFYFVMSTELNGGSEDMSAMVHSLEQFLLWEDKTGGNDNVVSVFTMLLLACRMVIYQYCKAAGADSRQWLLLQVASRAMLPGYDVFLSLFDRARNLLPLTREGVLEQKYAIQRALATLSRLQAVPTVAIDEAQIAMDMSRRHFYSQSRGWLPLVNRLVESLQVGLPFKPMILVTGTGSTLHYKKELIGGSGEKMVSSPELFMGFSAWDGPQSMKEFAQMVLRLSEDDLLLLSSRTWGVFPRFKGRLRPFCDVLQVMLLKKLTLKEASKYVIQAQTTSATKPEFPKTFYMRVAAVAGMRPVNHVSLIAELKEAVVSYFSSGRGWIIGGPDDAACVAAVEAGIARMTTDAYAAEIEEYLILLAARNFFEDEYAKEQQRERVDWLPQQVFKWMRTVPYPSPQGFCYQNYVACAFLAMWKKSGGKMADMPLFRPLLDADDCPSEFSNLANLAGRPREGLMDVLVHDGRYTLRDYLSDLKDKRQLCTSYVCENKHGADVAFGLEFGEYLLNCFHQHKLKQDPLSPSAMEDAITKSGITDPTLKHLCSGLELRIVFICPQSRQRLPAAFWEGQVGTIIVDDENAKYVFGDEIAKFLHDLKDGQGGAMPLECSYERFQEVRKKQKTEAAI